jgi:tetratricopeptide (TPR) repeat protein
VRIEGAGSSGSGVIVSRDGNNFYTVLTAWHSIGSTQPSEELIVITADKIRRRAITWKRIGKLDMGILVFFAELSKTYDVAKLEERGQAKVGSSVFVAGYVNDSDDLAKGYRFLKADIISMADQPTLEGYQMAYAGNDSTRLGMSGGPILLSSGQVVGIHGRRERDENSKASNTSLGIPVRLYLSAGVPSNSQGNLARSTEGSRDIHSTAAASSMAISTPAGAVAAVERLALPTPAEAMQSPSTQGAFLAKYLAKAEIVLGNRPEYDEVLIKKWEKLRLAVLRLSNPTLMARLTAEDLNLLGECIEKDDKKEATSLYGQALALNPEYVEAYTNRAYLKYKLGDRKGVIADCSKALVINPENDAAPFCRMQIGINKPEETAPPLKHIKAEPRRACEAFSNGRLVATYNCDVVRDNSGGLTSLHWSDGTASINLGGWVRINADCFAASESPNWRICLQSEQRPSQVEAPAEAVAPAERPAASPPAAAVAPLASPGSGSAETVPSPRIRVTVTESPERLDFGRFPRGNAQVVREGCSSGGLSARECGVSDGGVRFRSGSTSVASQANKPQVSALPQSSLTGPCAYYLDDWKGNTIGWIGLADENKLLMNIDGNVRAIPVNSRSAEQILAHDAMYYIEIRMPSWKKTGVELSSKANLKIANTSSETNLIVRATQLCSAD